MTAAAATDPAPTRGWRRVPLPLVVGVGLLIAGAVARPQQALTTVQSPRVWLLALAVVLATVLIRRLTRGLPAPAGSVLALLPVAAAAIFVVPTLRSTTVNEDLTGIAPIGTQSPAPSGAAAPTRLAVGEIKGIGHRGRGSASLVRLADGQLLVRLEALSVDPGPDYDVYVVPGVGRESPDGGTRLADLKGTSGNQNYPLGKASGALPLTVLVWCEAFSVPIAAATLQ